MLITKASGEQERFDEEKLRASLKNAGADEGVAGKVVEHVKKEISEGANTEEIYKHALNVLKDERKPLAARYSLKKAIIELGPTGFPFESFISEVLKSDGYEAVTGKTLMGKCVSHEVDVLAKHDERVIVIEAKFKNRPGLKTDVKNALYVYARLQDLLDSDFGGEIAKGQKGEGWLFTNAKFTTNAIRYGECVGLGLIGWGYPKKGNLQDLVESNMVHPITALTTLNPEQKKLLFERGIVLCRNLKENSSPLRDIGLNEKAAEEVMEEIVLLCQQ